MGALRRGSRTRAPEVRGRPSGLRLLRGATSIGLLWGGGWAVVGGGVSVAAAVAAGWPLAWVLPGVARFAFVGLLAGGLFSVLLSRAGRGAGSLGELGWFRTGVMGAVGAMVVVGTLLLVSGVASLAGMAPVLFQVVQAGVLGGASAAATLWAARSAPDA